MKNIFLAGSTGSIGKNSVEVALSYPEDLSIKGIAAGHFSEELKSQIIKIKPAYCILSSLEEMEKTRSGLNGINGFGGIIFGYGDEGLKEAVSGDDIDIVLNAISGSSGLLLSYFALESGKDLALANKESMVMAGEVLNKTATSKNAFIIPVDSEHSALFQCLNCGRKKDLKKLILTASGGPFFNTPAGEFSGITVEMALNHPRWKMGKKITIDSATLANKGLEIIEAQYLFGVKEEDIDVVIHPQAIIHSMVEFMDGSVIAQMGNADMKGPIGYALSYPSRFHGLMSPIDVTKIGKFEFFVPDENKFPFLNLARFALREGRSMPATFCEANEFFVNLFLEGEISFTDIALNVEKVMNSHTPFNLENISDVMEAKKLARELSQKFFLGR